MDKNWASSLWQRLIREGINIMVEPVFFSSRRRHTRFDCDWSSDVCSSDLNEKKLPMAPKIFRPFVLVSVRETSATPFEKSARSEERRVGKESRSRWSPYH